MKSDRERQIPYAIAYMWSVFLKKDTNKFIYKPEIHVKNKLNGYQGSKGKGDKFGRLGLTYTYYYI